MTEKESNRKLNLIELIRSEFQDRKERNSNYSLRAYAKALGLSHTSLSLAFSGKRDLSKESKIKISKILGIAPNTILHLDTKSKKTKKMRNKGYDYISMNDFEQISDWVHYAILSLMNIKTKANVDKSNPKWLSKRLNIDEKKAKSCFEHLKKLGFIKYNEDRGWIQTGKLIKVENKISTNFTKNFHKGLLSKAVESLENDPMEIRNFSSITFPANPEYLPYAIEQIKNFRRKLSDDFENSGVPKVVYNLTIQLYPVSKDIPD